MRVEILIGPIASGKSSYCKIRAKDGALIINDDDLFVGFHAGNHQLYSKELKGFYKSMEMHALQGAILLGRDVIIDRPNSRRDSRARYISMARACDVPVVGIIFERHVPEVHAERRFKSDSRGYDLAYWTRVAERHQAEWVSPTLDEGFTEIIKAPPFQ